MLLVALLAVAATDVTAVGVVTSAHPGAGSAILRSGGRVRVVAVGERAFGARLALVAPDHVVLEVDGERVELRLAGAPSAPLATPTPPRAEAPRFEAAPGEPVAVDQTLSREQVQRRLAAEIPRILGETALQPSTQDGRVGLRLVRVASGTLLTDLGLRPGDVLTEINGTPTDSLPALIGLWTSLQNETALRATVLRDGRPLQLSLTLR